MNNPKRNDDFMNQESRMVRVESVIESINVTLIRMDNRLDRIENRIGSVEQKFD
jgi:archaellum component FlaC